MISALHLPISSCRADFSRSVRRIALILAALLIIGGEHPASAQSRQPMSPSSEGAQVGLRPEPPSLPAYCQNSTLTGLKFLQLIHTIIAHGDLTDIPFLEKTLGTKFSSSYGYPAEVTPDKQILQLNSEQTLGNPIPVHIIIYYAKSDQLRMHQIAGLGFGDQSTFITDCFHFSPSDISSYFGGGFYRKMFFGSPISIYYQENSSPGKNGSKIYIAFSDGVENNLVDSIGFSQYP